MDNTKGINGIKCMNNSRYLVIRDEPVCTLTMCVGQGPRIAICRSEEPPGVVKMICSRKIDGEATLVCW